MIALSEKLSDILLVIKNLAFLKIGTVLTLHNLWVWASFLIFTYLSYLAGDLLLRYLGFGDLSRRRRIIFAIPLGYGLIGFLGLILALLGLFNWWMLWIAAATMLIASKFANSEGPGFFSAENPACRQAGLKTPAGRAPYILQNMRILPLIEFFRAKIFRDLAQTDGASRAIPQQRDMRVNKNFAHGKILKIILVVWLLADFLIVLVPVTGHDTLDYHLPVINKMIAEGGIAFAADNRVIIPFFGEIIYAAPMVMFRNFSEPFIFQAMQFGFFLLFLLMFYDFFAPLLKNKIFALAIPLLLMSITDFQREVMHGGYVDVMMYFYGFLGSLIIMEYIAGGMMQLLREGARFMEHCGVQRRRDEQNMIPQQRDTVCSENRAHEKKISNMLILASIFFGIALSIKYNALFFIFIGALFLAAFYLYKKIPPRDILKNFFAAFLVIAAIAGIWYAKNIYFYGNPVYPMFSVPEVDAAVKTFAMPVNFANYFAFPFYRFSSWFVSDRASSGDLVILAFFLALYPLLILNLILKRKLGIWESLLLIFYQIMAALVFVSSHQVRFMLPMMIILPPLLILLLDNIWEYFRIPQKAGSILMVLFFIVMFLGSMHYFRNRYFYATGVFDRPTYIIKIGGL